MSENETRKQFNRETLFFLKGAAVLDIIGVIFIILGLFSFGDRQYKDVREVNGTVTEASLMYTGDVQDILDQNHTKRQYDLAVTVRYNVGQNEYFYSYTNSYFYELGEGDKAEKELSELIREGDAQKLYVAVTDNGVIVTQNIPKTGMSTYIGITVIIISVILYALAFVSEKIQN